MVKERCLRVGELLLVIALLAPPFAFSQQPPDSSSTQDPGSANPPTQTQTSGTEADNGVGSRYVRRPLKSISTTSRLLVPVCSP